MEERYPVRIQQIGHQNAECQQSESWWGISRQYLPEYWPWGHWCTTFCFHWKHIHLVSFRLGTSYWPHQIQLSPIHSKNSVTIPTLEISHKVRALGFKIKAQCSKPDFHVEEQTLKIWKLELGSQVLTIGFTHGQSTNMLSADQLQ